MAYWLNLDTTYLTHRMALGGPQLMILDLYSFFLCTAYVFRLVTKLVCEPFQICFKITFNKEK